MINLFGSYKFTPTLAAVAMMAIAGSLLINPVAAQEKLRIADSLPIGHFFAESGTKFWMQRVTDLTKGAVTFEYFPAEQLGKAKDLLTLTRSGVVDIGYVVPSYVSEKMPMSAVAELPGSFKTSCGGTLAFYDLAEHGVLEKEEFAANGVRVLFALVTPPYQLFTSHQKIEGVKSITGLKLRTTGGAMDATVRWFQGIPVRMAAPDMYQSLSRGTVDGTLFPYASVISYDLVGLTKYATTGENFGSAVLTYVISETRWKRLSPEIQQALTQAGEEATRHACETSDTNVVKEIEQLRAKGVTVEPLPAADRPTMAAATDAVAKDWAQSLDGRGKPGSATLAAFNAALAKVEGAAK
jgi:TRAP-type C4-dicarboxylate transport system substrate-binding protein